jgi:hypothetical protein
MSQSCGGAPKTAKIEHSKVNQNNNSITLVAVEPPLPSSNQLAAR